MTEKLVSRLRDLEVECVRLSDVQLLVSQQSILEEYEERLHHLQNSHSRSWFGDHSATYFEDFKPPPSGHSFDVEWGFVYTFGATRNLGWTIYPREEIRRYVFASFGEAIFHDVKALSEEVSTKYALVRDQALDVLTALSRLGDSDAITRYRTRIETKLQPYTIADYINASARSAPRMTRDSEEIAKGSIVPAHVQYLGDIQSLEISRARSRGLADTLRNVIEMVDLLKPYDPLNKQKSRIFIGHGRSEQWRILKDFLHERLGLAYDEFNRISAAGINTQERLSEMVDQCGFAFLVMTAEDLDQAGSFRARENVVHEAGLFQGRLGWRKAIILLEDECAEFSNIIGLGQIRFPKGNIAACFETIRQVLEREGVLGK